MEDLTIDIIGKEWFDKINGNSYHSAQVTINNDAVLYVPLTYGYDDHYLQSALKLLKAEYIIAKDFEGSLSRYCYDNNISLDYHIIKKCLKRDVKSWGEE